MWIESRSFLADVKIEPAAFMCVIYGYIKFHRKEKVWVIFISHKRKSVGDINCTKKSKSNLKKKNLNILSQLFLLAPVKMHRL